MPILEDKTNETTFNLKIRENTYIRGETDFDFFEENESMRIEMFLREMCAFTPLKINPVALLIIFSYEESIIFLSPHAGVGLLKLISPLPCCVLLH